MVCNYRTFRGLEHLKITVAVECDKYFLEHYLLETFPRYTATLFVVIFQNNKVKQRNDLIFKKKKSIVRSGCTLGTHKKKTETRQVNSTEKAAKENQEISQNLLIELTSK